MASKIWWRAAVLLLGAVMLRATHTPTLQASGDPRRARLSLAQDRAVNAAARCVPLPAGADGTGAPRTARVAAQLGLHWLECAALSWQTEHQCFGCHVQAQALMAQAVALKQDYIVNRAAMDAFTAMTREQQQDDGTWPTYPPYSTPYGVMGLAYHDEAVAARDDRALRRGVEWLMTEQLEDGLIPADDVEPPIMQGRFLSTTGAIVGLMKAHDDTRDPRYAAAAEKAARWIAGAQPETTQDQALRILGLVRAGGQDRARLVRSGTERLLAEQQPDGGWKETRDMEASNAYATGQVLYAFKQAGVSVHSLAFSRGVQYLLRTQVHGTGTDRDGSWPARNTQSARPADFAPTMWAVLGLVGAFGTASVGGLQVLNDVHRERPPARAVEIVLDVSGSMNQRIGARTRWQTALQVLKDVVGRLPDDLRVGLRAYGHRQSSRSPETCSDSELLVPIETLDRDRVLNAVAALTPRGETPLVYSIMLAADDFPPNERGSLIVITDGEESCGGQIESVVERLKSAGTDVSLHIVGFALTSRRVEQQLAAAAENTGGRFYGAQNGDELSRALALASTPSFPYEVFDSAGTRVAARETGPLAEELSPGVYRVVVRALGQELVQQVVVEADKVATLKLLVRGNRLVLEP